MVKRLCIGGVGDGRWIEEPAPMPYLVVSDERLVRQGKWPEADPFSGQISPDVAGHITNDVYRPMRIEFGGHTIVVLVVAGLRPAEVLIKLVEGYRAKPA